MLGPVSSVASSARRRARRRTRLIVLAIVLVAFIVGELIDEVVNDGTATAARSAKTWVAAVESPISDANSQSVDMQLVVTKGPSMTRPQLTDVLSALVTSATQDKAAVGEISLVPPTGSAASSLLRALSLRSEAVADFRQGTLGAITDGAGGNAHRELSQAGSLLREAVAAYQVFLRRLPPHSGASVLPKANWSMPASMWAPHSLTVFAQLLSAAPQLRARSGLSITDISLSPLPEVIPTTTTTTVVVPTSSTLPNVSTSTTTGTSPKKKRTTTTTTTTTLAPISQIPTGNVPSVIAPTSTLAVIVVVTNTGNVNETNVMVQARLGGELVASPPIASLAPSRSRYIRLRTLAVHTASMSPCVSVPLHHDRCTTLRVSVTASSGTSAIRHLPLAFFVS